MDLETYKFPPADIAIVPGSGYRIELDSASDNDFVPYLDFLGVSSQSVFDDRDGGYYYKMADNKVVLLFNRRLHCYQGFSATQTVLPIQIANNSKVKVILLLNAAGGLNPDFKVGDIVVLKRQIIQPEIPQFFKDFTGFDSDIADSPFDPELTKKMLDIVSGVTGSSRLGSYAYMPGPAYETHAEVKYLRSLGADIVGMSTAYEALYAVLHGIKVVGCSLVTNVHNDHFGKLTHDEVLRESEKANEKINVIVRKFIEVV